MVFSRFFHYCVYALFDIIGAENRLLHRAGSRIIAVYNALGMVFKFNVYAVLFADIGAFARLYRRIVKIHIVQRKRARYQSN